MNSVMTRKGTGRIMNMKICGNPNKQDMGLEC